MRDHPIAQFIGNAFARRPLRKAKARLPGLGLGVAAFAITADILGGLLKFVVNLRLPIGPFRQQHYISESSRRHETCSGGVQRGLELKGGRLPGIRHHSNLETRIRGLR
jgi:hypothetical protein